MAIAVHVDDCTLAAQTLKVIEDFKAELGKHVEVTDLGELHWLLGMEVKRDREARSIHLSQLSYIDSILCRHNLDEAKPLTTPMDPNIHLSTADCPASTANDALMRNVNY